MRTHLWIWSLAWLVISPAAWAQEKASLAQMIAWAVARSPVLEEGNANVASAQALLAEARGHRWFTGELFGLVAPVADAKGQPGSPAPGYSSGKLNNITDWEWGTLKIIQPLYTFGKLDAYGRAAKAGVEVAKARREQKRMEVAIMVTEAYQTYLLANTALYLTKEVDDILAKAIRRTKKLLNRDSDEVSPTDLLKLENARGLLLKRHYEAEEGKRITLSALRILTGRDVIPAEATLNILALPAYSLEQWVSFAKQDRPEYREAAFGLIAKQALVEAKKAEAYPDIFIIGLLSAAHSSGRDRIIDPFIRDDFNHFYGTVGIGLRWKFDWAINDARVAKAEAEKAVVAAKKRFADEMIPLQVEKDYRQLMSLRRQSDALRKASRAGRQWLISSASSYDLGVGEAKEIFEALGGYAMAEAGRLQAMFAHNMMAVQLLRHVGRLRADTISKKGE